MSVRCMSWAWEIDGITPVQKLVLMRLADHANDEGVAWPGKDHLAERCGCSKRTVDSAIQALIDAGHIRVRRRRTDSGFDASNVYELQISQRDLFADSERKASRGAESAPPPAESAPGGAIDAHRGAAAAPEPSLEPTTTTARAEKPKSKTFDDFQPSDELRKRIRMARPNITDEFIDDPQRRAAFLTHAEANYRRDQLELKFLKWVTGDWTTQKSSSRGMPRDAEQLAEWSRSKGGPAPRPGEPPAEYRARVQRWRDGGMPAVTVSERPVNGDAWCTTWPGVMDKAAEIGINLRDHDEPVELIGAVIAKLKSEGQVPPDHLIKWHQHLLSQESLGRDPS